MKLNSIYQSSWERNCWSFPFPNTHVVTEGGPSLSLRLQRNFKVPAVKGEVVLNVFYCFRNKTMCMEFCFDSWWRYLEQQNWIVYILNSSCPLFINIYKIIIILGYYYTDIHIYSYILEWMKPAGCSCLQYLPHLTLDPLTAS